MSYARRVVVGGAAAAAAALTLLAAAAWACIPVATLTLTPSTVKPGDTVNVTGRFYGTKSPVVLHSNTIDGPVLATATPDDQGNIAATFTAPANTGTSMVVVATQATTPGDTTWGVPSRALLTVSSSGATPAVGATRAADVRPADLVHTSTLSTSAFVLTALGVAGIGLFVAGACAVFLARRPRPAGQAAVVRS
jgi:hypothetical protein